MVNMSAQSPSRHPISFALINTVSTALLLMFCVSVLEEYRLGIEDARKAIVFNSVLGPLFLRSLMVHQSYCYMSALRRLVGFLVNGALVATLSLATLTVVDVDIQLEFEWTIVWQFALFAILGACWASLLWGVNESLASTIYR
ncbi:hypothetical protein NOR53_1934 [gamma proteobacterium NOR5-3]|nr:hypothetical protein NOR53_1934 [gamma proteobacterium NOR5-3]